MILLMRVRIHSYFHQMCIYIYIYMYAYVCAGPMSEDSLGVAWLACKMSFAALLSCDFKRLCASLRQQPDASARRHSCTDHVTAFLPTFRWTKIHESIHEFGRWTKTFRSSIFTKKAAGAASAAEPVVYTTYMYACTHVPIYLHMP